MDIEGSVRFDRRFGRFFYPWHRRLYQWTRGRIGAKTSRGPILLITTTGRRSGEPRTTPLLYMPDGDGFVVVGSNGGRDQPPAWLLNLSAKPQATVQVRGRKMHARAEILRRPASDDLWPRLSAHYEGWRYYQSLTEREIPVVRLAPTPAQRSPAAP